MAREIDIMSILNVIRSQSALGKSERLYRLLDFIVKEEIAGRGERLKAYVIGTEVLGRPTGFDPQTDSIVRVEMARLRTALQLFFLQQGADLPVLISIPVGSYRPVILLRCEAGTSGQPAPTGGRPENPIVQNSNGRATPPLPVRISTLRRPWRAVSAFLIAFVLALGAIFIARISENWELVKLATHEKINIYVIYKENEYFEKLFATKLVESVVKFFDYRIYTNTKNGDTRNVYGKNEYAIKLYTFKNDDEFYIANVFLSNLSDNRVIESINVKYHKDEDYSKIISDMVKNIADELQYDGAILQDYAKKIGKNKVCSNLQIQQFHFYSKLEGAAVSDCGHVEALGPTDDHRQDIFNTFAYRYGIATGKTADDGAVRRLALAAAQKAVELEPRDSRSHFALMSAYALVGNRQMMLDAGSYAAELNPLDAIVMEGVAQRFAREGLGEEALMLLARAAAVKPTASYTRHYASFLAYVVSGNLEKAAEHGLALSGSRISYHVAASAIAHGLRNEVEGQAKAMSRLIKVEALFGSEPAKVYGRLNYSPEVVTRLVALLPKLPHS